MKKILALILVIVMALSLAACTLAKCDLCGEFGLHQERSLGFSSNKYPVCNDCYNSYTSIFR